MAKPNRPGSISALLTVKQLAECLKVSEKTVYNWVRETSIPHHRFGRTIRFVEQEVLQWGRQADSTRSEMEQ